MAWIARNEDKRLLVFNKKPSRSSRYNSKTEKEMGIWAFISSNIFDSHQFDDCTSIELPSNADEKLIGKHINWEDEPVEI